MWLVRNGGWLGRRRRATQGLRRVSDREASSHLSPVFDPHMLELPPGASLANVLVRAWWCAVRVVL
jgi:hypothetical protein